MMNQLFEYPVTRPIQLRLFAQIVITLGILWSVIVTLISIAAVGYESVTIYSDTYNSTEKLWYEKIFPKSDWIPTSRVCEASTIKFREILTASGLLQYTLLGYLDASPDSPVDQMMYRNYALQNCTIHKLVFGQSNNDKGLGQSEATVACNTSANQYLGLTITGEVMNALNIDRITWLHPFTNLNTSSPFNLTSALAVWFTTEANFLALLSPKSGSSWTSLFLDINNLSSWSLGYDDTGNIEGEHNSPANDRWTFSFQFLRKNSTIPQILRIVYLSSGQIDHENTKASDFTTANAILKPFTDILKLITLKTGIDLDIWRVINFIWVSAYWTVLVDLGQISPVTYAAQPNQAFYNDDFYKPKSYAATNNIFYNDTLFTIYSNYLLKTFMPLFNATPPPAGFAPLSETNRINTTETAFKRSYTCTVRQWKAPLTALVSVLVAQYALIRGGYSLVMFVATWYQKRKMTEGSESSDEVLMVANYCQGCQEYHSQSVPEKRVESNDIWVL